MPLVFQIQASAHGTVHLHNTHVAMSIFTPGPMGEGNWSMGLYLDERATQEQRAALE